MSICIYIFILYTYRLQELLHMMETGCFLYGQKAVHRTSNCTFVQQRAFRVLSPSNSLVPAARPALLGPFALLVGIFALSRGIPMATMCFGRCAYYMPCSKKHAR